MAKKPATSTKSKSSSKSKPSSKVVKKAAKASTGVSFVNELRSAAKASAARRTKKF